MTKIQLDSPFGPVPVRPSRFIAVQTALIVICGGVLLWAALNSILWVVVAAAELLGSAVVAGWLVEPEVIES